MEANKGFRSFLRCCLHHCAFSLFLEVSSYDLLGCASDATYPWYSSIFPRLTQYGGIQRAEEHGDAGNEKLYEIIMERKLRVLHITPDDKFFDGVFGEWEKNEDFENMALFYAPKKKYRFKYIKRTDILEIYYNKKDIIKRLQAADYDVVFVHSMPASFYQFVSCIPEGRVVIWWGWGFDIYEPKVGLPPIVDISLFRKITLGFVNKLEFSPRTMLKSIAYFIFRRKLSRQQSEAISRVDYYQPVVKLEYELVRRCKHFRAKEFYYKTAAPETEDYNLRPAEGSILIGNSVTPSNNHLDVLEVVKRYKHAEQSILMPLSYGSDKYKRWLKPYLQSPDIMPLYDFMPQDDYFKLVADCSYAVYGTMRQQALGNIYYALLKGIKVFLYRDSVTYQNFKDLGVVVFAIEDMNEESLRTPLTSEEMEQNNKAMLAEYSRRMTVYQVAIEEIKKLV